MVLWFLLKLTNFTFFAMIILRRFYFESKTIYLFLIKAFFVTLVSIIRGLKQAKVKFIQG